MITLENVSPLDTPNAQEVIAYTLGTFAGVLTNEELMALDNNLKAFIIGESIQQTSVNRRISKFRTHDVYHFGCNIAKRLKISNTMMAEFLKLQFPWQLADVEISTIAKNFLRMRVHSLSLKSSRVCLYHLSLSPRNSASVKYR